MKRNKLFLILAAFVVVAATLACSFGGGNSEPIDGLAGQWEDQYELTVHTIEWDGSNYKVTGCSNPEKGTYSIVSQSWDGTTLTWTYQVPGGADVGLSTVSVSGDELNVNWWSSNGNSGVDTFLRYP